jgi:alkylhydroperoxidase/carboxymuconolactone decarboxylase family protein YurZ
MDNGLTQEQAAEAIMHRAYYAGWPNAFAALALAKAVSRSGRGNAQGTAGNVR